MDKQKRALEGLKVLDFTTVIAGPLMTKTMTAHGAHVIKIESRSRPGLFRAANPGREEKPSAFNPWLNRSASFGFWNTGKVSLALNLATPKGIEIAKRLVAWADVVTENYAGGVIKRLGLGYEELTKIKPDIIMLSSCMQGQTGPHSRHPGYGTQLVNLAGFSNVSGWPDREPVNIGPYTDYVAPRFSLLAIMAAVDYRRRTGKGQYIDLSQYEAGIHLLAPLVLDNVVNKRVVTRMGNQVDNAAPHNAYPCKDRHTDRWVAFGVGNDEEWEKFCKAMGNPAWTKDLRFTTLKARREHETELDAILEDWTIKMLPLDIKTRFEEAEIPVAILDNPDEFRKHLPQVKKRSPYTVPHNVYRCRWEDRWCVIAIFTDEEWRTFCRVIGNPSWAADPRFATLQGRKANELELDALISAWTLNYTPHEIMNMLQPAGVAAGAVQTGEDLMEHDPQMRHRKFYRKLDHPEIGTFHGVTPSFIMSKSPADIRRSPLLGEHNEIVLKEILGMSDAEIEELVLEGVIE